MDSEARAHIRVRVVAIDPPSGVPQLLFGLQDTRGAVDPVPATRTTDFETEIEVVSADPDALDFRGEHVSGRKGDRFIYLSWGVSDDAEPFVMFARAKIRLAHIPADLLAAAADGGTDLECVLQATNAKGHPASGTISAPALHWQLPD